MRVAVTSPSFSKHPVLRDLMAIHFKEYKLNEEGSRFEKAELVNFLSGFDAAIVGLEEMTPDVLNNLPDLKIIAKYGVGLNNIDLEYCEKKGISIGWSGGVNRLSVAEMCLGNMISLIRNIVPSSRLLAKTIWEKNGGEQLTGKRIGIIGLGHIGKELVRLLQPFHCTILVNDIDYDTDFISEHNLIISSKETLISTCQVVSVHTPLTKDTYHMIGKSELSAMQDGAILINSARGGIVDEEALLIELRTERLFAALDVFEMEPPKNEDLLSMANLVATPHIGGNAKEAIELMGKSAINHLLNFQCEK